LKGVKHENQEEIKEKENKMSHQNHNETSCVHAPSYKEDLVEMI
jgi:hypothetical protein